MKKKIILLLLILVSVFAFKYQNIMHVYISKNEYGLKDFLELNLENCNGNYYGTLKGKTNNVIFYKANIDTFIIDNGTIRFSIENLKFSHTDFYINSVNEPLSNTDVIPFFYKHRITFFGEYSSDSLSLNRISSSYDSRSDEFTFKLIKK